MQHTTVWESMRDCIEMCLFTGWVLRDGNVLKRELDSPLSHAIN